MVRDEVQDGFLATALLGDVLKKRETGGLFHCTETNVDQQRLDIGEIDPTGPLYGPKMKTALDTAGERESMIREACGLSIRHGSLLGAWRPAVGGWSHRTPRFFLCHPYGGSGSGHTSVHPAARVLCDLCPCRARAKSSGHIRSIFIDITRAECANPTGSDFL